jgi:spore coat protein GerQ
VHVHQVFSINQTLVGISNTVFSIRYLAFVQTGNSLELVNQQHGGYNLYQQEWNPTSYLTLSQMTPPSAPTPPSLPAIEESYIENILRMNRGKMATIYMTFENNSEWNAKVFKGVIENAGRDHIIISDPKTGMRYLLQMVNLDYITFDEPLNYSYPFNGATPIPMR